jgi:hypothetical protein
MSSNGLIGTGTDGGSEKPWGKANPNRGANYIDDAMAFIKQFPIGSKLSPEAFDEWAQKRGALNVPTGAPKQSDAWKAYLQRRHELRYGINRAATHPRMEPPFVIDAISFGLWEVRTPQMSISQNKILVGVQSLFNTRRRQLAYLMQSADWSALPVHERIFAENLYDQIDNFREDVERHANRLTLQFSRLESKLRTAIESGEVHCENGGIQRLLEHHDLPESHEE